MNFIAKQVIKNKTGGITDKFDEFSKKCKDLVISDEQSTSDPVVQQTDEEKTAKIEEQRKAHYESINAKREEQRQQLRDKYGLTKPEEAKPKSEDIEPQHEQIAENTENDKKAKKERDCCIL